MNNRQTVRLLQQLTRMFRAGGSTRWLAVLIVVGIAAVALVRPSWLGGSGTADSNVAPPHVSASESSDDASPGQSGATAARNPAAKTAGSDDGDLLTRMPGDAMRSPAGLVYTRGSRHGHRLKHVMAHGDDDANRPGQHGVFQDGTQAGIVRLLDEAYAKYQAGGRNVRRKVDDGRDVLTIDMGRVIGYVGGESGNRRGRPTARHVRMILEDDRVITAYPLIP